MPTNYYSLGKGKQVVQHAFPAPGKKKPYPEALAMLWCLFPGLPGEPGADETGRDRAAPGGLGRQLAEGDGTPSSAGCSKKSRLFRK